MKRFPPLNALRVFEAAARHQNFRIAAEELGVTQGAVAQQVRGLEAALKVRLFDRMPRKLALTDEGRRYLTSIQRALDLIADATERLRPQQTGLTLSVTPSFASKWLVPRLGRFTRANPDIDVKVVAAEELADFQRDGVDIAVRQGKPPFGPGLSADLLYPLEVFAVCSPALRCGKEPLRKLEDLSGHVLLHDAHGLWPVFLEKALGDRQAIAAKSLQFSQSALAIDAAVAGQGVALASDPLVEEDIGAGRLCRPFDFVLEADIGFYAVAPRAPRHPDPVKRMRAWLLEQCRPAFAEQPE